MNSSRLVNYLIIGIAVVVILVFGKNLLQPFALALLIWLLIKAIRDFVKKLKFGKRSLPVWIYNILSFILIFGVLGLAGNLLSYNITNMSEKLPLYEENFNEIVAYINNVLGIDIYALFDEYTGEFDFKGVFSAIFSSITEVFGDTFMIILYVLFLMLEEAIFPKKIKAMFSDQEKFEKANELIKKINKSVNSYISIKTLVSLITATASYIALLIIGVDFAFFWAFIIFILNFIPTIGSLIATVFPALMALLQNAAFTPFVLVLIIIGAIQLAVGNFIEPKITGKSLNISTLTILLTLGFWGAIWGIVGMILSVPITVILMIIFAQFPTTRKISILASSDGNV